MVVVLFISAAVSVAGVQGGPLVVGSQAAVSVGQRVVEDSAGGHEGDGSQGCGAIGRALGWGGGGSEVLVSHTYRLRNVSS